ASEALVGARACLREVTLRRRRPILCSRPRHVWHDGPVVAQGVPAITEATEMKKVLVALMLGLGLAALGAGCSKESGGGGAEAGAAGDKIGVAECDDYITKFQACMGKMPAAAKPAQEAAFKQMHDSWKAAAAPPAGKDGLKTGCKAALDGL